MHLKELHSTNTDKEVCVCVGGGGGGAAQQQQYALEFEEQTVYNAYSAR